MSEHQQTMSLTDSAGGYLVSVQLNPSIVITGSGSQDGIASIPQQGNATGDVWSGVSTAQISAQANVGYLFGFIHTNAAVEVGV